MQRQIKFRAWDKLNRKMYTEEIESIAFARNGNPCNVSLSGFSKPLLLNGGDPQLTLMQFTGLKDKNEKEICEGDVIRVKWGGIGRIDWQDGGFVNVFEDGHVTRRLTEADIAERETEVIGNLYENPELLEK